MSKKKIIVIDDSSTVRKVIESYLKDKYEVVFVKDDKFSDSIFVIKKEKPSLVLLDVNLGKKGVDGYKICREIREDDEVEKIPVVMMSGTDEELDVYEAFLSGTNIFIRKPFSKEKLLGVIEKLLFPKKEFKKEKILIVDDSKSLRAILRHELEEGGYEIFEASSGESAIEIAREKNPDLIILDYEMEGLNGIETAKLLKENIRTYDISLLMLSSNDSPQIISEAFNAGIAEYFIKPFKKGELLSYVEDVLSSLKKKGTEKVKVLVIDDSRVQRASIVHLLKKIGYDVKEEESGKEALQIIKSDSNIDFVITDIFLKDINGIELSKQLKRERPSLFVIGVSSTRNRDTVVKALRSGMDEFIHLPVYEEELSLRIRMHLELREKIEKLKEANRKLKEASIKDFLTGLYNRRFFMNKLESELLMAKREGLVLSFLMFDIDHFKKINDTFGHKVGDLVLKKFSEVLAKNSKEYYTVGRVGGEEFAVILPQTDLKEAFSFGEKIRKSVENLEIKEIFPEKITVSGGVASTKEISDFNEREIFIKADEKLYRAKKEGRNRIVF